MDFLRNRGFDVVVGSRLDNSGYVRAPALDRAAELTSMPVDPTVRPVIPPWAVVAIDLLPRPHWAQIPFGTPTKFVGLSDPLHLREARDHALRHHHAPGKNPMDPLSRARTPAVVAGRHDPAIRQLLQEGPCRLGYRASGIDDWEQDPTDASSSSTTPTP